jgi:hypothetical protein
MRALSSGVRLIVKWSKAKMRSPYRGRTRSKKSDEASGA